MMEFISSVEFCAPFYQIALLLALSTLALIFGNPKIALLISYLFTLYWVYMFDRAHILEAGTKISPIFPWLYFGFGFVVILLAAVGFFLKKN